MTCHQLLLNIFLQDGVEDTWDWRIDPGKGHTVHRV